MNYRALVIEALRARDGDQCGLCREPFLRQAFIHLDHITSRVNGGPDTFANLQLVHGQCNIKAGGKTTRNYKLSPTGEHISYAEIHGWIVEALRVCEGD